jgi:hypothetical protein
VIVEPGLIASQKNRPGSDRGSVSLEKLTFLLDIYLGALAIAEGTIITNRWIDYKLK